MNHRFKSLLLLPGLLPGAGVRLINVYIFFQNKTYARIPQQNKRTQYKSYRVYIEFIFLRDGKSVH